MEFSAITANGQPLDVMGSIMANVMVGTLDMQHKFYIAGDINSDGIPLTYKMAHLIVEV